MSFYFENKADLEKVDKIFQLHFVLFVFNRYYKTNTVSKIIGVVVNYDVMKIFILTSN